MERELVLGQRLASATQRIRWNYSIFWSFCPQQQVLVWGEGFLNGAESLELSLRRSQQLRELFTAVNTNTTQPYSQANSVSQQVQGLTPTELFYMCSMACVFSSGAGLPGRAYEGKGYVWHCITSEGDIREPVRARLAQRARIQTIVCIPALNGVVEFGTTTLVEETSSLLQQIQSAFSAYTTRDMSAFKTWSTRGRAPYRQQQIHRQRMLKAALLTVPRLHAVKETVDVVELVEVQLTDSERVRESQASSHAAAERRRREKLNNGYETLRSLVPLATKSDQVSLLGGAIEYVRVLQVRVEELESSRKRPQVEVTMVNDNEAVVKLTCPWKDGVFIGILQSMVALHLEVVEATAKVSDGLLTATLKAKVPSSDKLDNDEKRDKIQAALLSTIEGKLSDTAHEP